MFRVRIEAEAKDNLREHYQNLRSPNLGSAYPDRWYLGIRAAIRDMATSAEGCGLAYEDRFFAETIRQRLFDSYKILFVIREDRVHVLHIRHQAQDPEDLLGSSRTAERSRRDNRRGCSGWSGRASSVLLPVHDSEHVVPDVQCRPQSVGGRPRPGARRHPCAPAPLS